MQLFTASRALAQHDAFLTQLCWAQVNMQAVVLVSVFRQQTRDKLIEYVEWCLPDRIPWLWDHMGYRQTPAQMVHSAIVSKISAFQAGVARRQSAAHSDPRLKLSSPFTMTSCRRLAVASRLRLLDLATGVHFSAQDAAQAPAT